MAIAYDSSSAGNVNGAYSSLTYAHTCSGSDRVLLVGWITIDSNSRTLSSITYNGTASSGDVYAPYTPPGYRYTGMVYFLAPATGGSYNIVITLSGAVSHNIASAAASYTGVKQTGFPAQKDETLTNPGTSCVTTVTTTTNNCWLSGFGHLNDAGTFSAGANTTKRTQNPTYANAWVAMFDSNGARATGSNSIECTYVSNTILNMMTVSLEEAGESVTVDPAKTTTSLGLTGIGS